MTLAFSGLALASDHDNHWKDKHVEHHHQVSPGLEQTNLESQPKRK